MQLQQPDVFEKVSFRFPMTFFVSDLFIQDNLF